MSDTENKIQQIVDFLHEEFKSEKEKVAEVISEAKKFHVVHAVMLAGKVIESAIIAVKLKAADIGEMTDKELKAAVVQFGDESLVFTGLKAPLELIDGPAIGMAYDFVKAQLDKTDIDEKLLAQAKAALNGIQEAVTVPEGE